MAIVDQLAKAAWTMRWLPAYAWQTAVRREPRGPVHLIVSAADHFEPAIAPEAPGRYATRDVQEQRLDRWCHEYPRLVDGWRDSDGHAFKHTYFYPAEQYDKALIDQLTEHCLGGWGEIEIHLHHGIERPDTSEATRRALVDFRDALASRGCLARWNGTGQPRYAFVHGNWALANSADGAWCGVDDEMQILSETGCYADMTLPSAPNRAQTARINSLYECALPLARRAPPRRGRDLRRGRAPVTFPLIVQGPLGLNFDRTIRGIPVPRIENSALTGAYVPSLRRLSLWRRAAIKVLGRPDWMFIKLHCHGMDPRDEDAMLGPSMARFLRELAELGRADGGPRVHFVTAREMVNIALAACDGRDGEPGEYRDYRLQPIGPRRG